MISVVYDDSARNACLYSLLSDIHMKKHIYDDILSASYKKIKFI